MDLIAILHVLSRRRVLLGLSCVLAVVVGLLVAFRVTVGPPPTLQSRQYTVGQASMHVLVDTPSSQVADLDPPVGADVLTQRASLFTNLIATGPVQTLIANRMHIPLDRLDIIAPSTTSALVPTPLATTATSDGTTGAAYQVTVRADETLPILAIETEAPNAASAAALADSTFLALREHLQQIAVAQHIPQQRKPVVSALGTAVAGETQRGPSKAYGALAALATLVLCCSAIVIADGMLRRWREPYIRPDTVTDHDRAPATQRTRSAAVPHTVNGTGSDVRTRT